MKTIQHRWIAALLKYIPLVLSLSCLLFFFFTRKNLTVEGLLQYSPENVYLAAAMMLLLYAGKSMSVIFPMMVIQIACGHLFSLPTALFINLIGMIIILALPYWLGYFSGRDFLASLMAQHPKLSLAVEYQQQDCLFVTFFLRIISILPGDIVSMYFGATQTPFWRYLLGSSLGTVPGVLTSTLMGSALEDPASPMFLISLLITLLLSLASLLLHSLVQKRKQKKKNQDNINSPTN